jgi:hypothetical protein
VTEPGKVLEVGIEREGNGAFRKTIPLLGDFQVRQGQGGNGFGAQLGKRG